MKNVKYTTLVKPNTFIGKYMSYMSGLETPSSYDFWTAVWLTSLALGRGLVVSRPRIPVHMNWYIILCAEGGLTRKSTACRCLHPGNERYGQYHGRHVGGARRVGADHPYLIAGLHIPDTGLV